MVFKKNCNAKFLCFIFCFYTCLCIGIFFAGLYLTHVNIHPEYITNIIIRNNTTQQPCTFNCVTCIIQSENDIIEWTINSKNISRVVTPHQSVYTHTFSEMASDFLFCLTVYVSDFEAPLAVNCTSSKPTSHFTFGTFDNTEYTWQQINILNMEALPEAVSLFNTVSFLPTEEVVVHNIWKLCYFIPASTQIGNSC